MRIPRLLTLAVAIVVVLIVVVIGVQIVRPARPLIESAGFDRERITPNADGVEDIATFSYTLTRNATITLAFLDAEGREFLFRDSQPRIADDYHVLFSGVVHGYVLPGETVMGEVETRLLPDGDYTWILTAVDENGESEQAQGTLTIADADAQLPDLTGFSVPPLLTPNQDGISDRAQIHVYVEKDARLTMYLVGPEGNRYYITERSEERNFGEAGAHVFDYDGGIDAGDEPPPDGDYEVVLIAEDAEGQRVRRTAALSIRDGGVPMGAVYPQPTGTTVFYDTMPYDERYYTDAETVGDLIPVPEGVESIITDREIVVQGDMLVFRLTITNDGPVGLRTTGPPPGTVYQQEQRASTLGWFDESGAWRVGLECDTVQSSYPWRWAIAPRDQLVAVQDGEETYYYLPPGERAVVWGAVRLTEIVPRRNPQPCWIGLIHEDVAVRQGDVDRRWVEIVPGPESAD